MANSLFQLQLTTTPPPPESKIVLTLKIRQNQKKKKYLAGPGKLGDENLRNLIILTFG